MSCHLGDHLIQGFSTRGVRSVPMGRVDAKLLKLVT